LPAYRNQPDRRADANVLMVRIAIALESGRRSSQTASTIAETADTSQGASRALEFAGAVVCLELVQFSPTLRQSFGPPFPLQQPGRKPPALAQHFERVRNNAEVTTSSATAILLAANCEETVL